MLKTNLIQAMEQYTPVERGAIVTAYLTNFRSVVLTQREFLRRFPGRCAPCEQTIQQLAEYLMQTGSTRGDVEVKLKNVDESPADNTTKQNTQGGNNLESTALGFQNPYLLKNQLNTTEIQNSKKIKDDSKSSAGGNNLSTPFGKHQCFICSYNTATKVDLIQHLQKHFSRQHLKCPVCEQGFSSSQSLRVHITVRAGIKNYQCKNCDQSFISNSTLWRHNKEKHSGENPTKCTNCDFSSVDQRKLRQHMITHVVERHHKCPQCEFATTSSGYLKNHLKRHTGAKRYECGVCHSRFSEAYMLRRHLKIHLKKS